MPQQHIAFPPTLAACVCALAVAAPSANGQEPPVSAPTFEIGAPVDLDTTPCSSTVEGLVYTEGFTDGQYAEEHSASRALWFSQWIGDDGSLPESAGPWEPAVPHGEAETVLIAPPTRLVSSVLPSALLPGAAIALAGPTAEGQYDLVRLAPESLEPSSWWSSTSRPLVVGRVGSALVLILRRPDGPAASIVAVSESEGTAGTAPTPVDFPGTEALHELPVGDVTAPLVVPVAHDAFALLCSGQSVCLARIGGDAVEVAVVPLPATSLGYAADGAPLALLESGACITLDDDAASWPTREPVACPEYLDDLGGAGLPVDGSPVLGARMAVSQCTVRDRLALPWVEDASLSAEAASWRAEAIAFPPGVVVLGPRAMRFGALELDLLVSAGESLAVGYTGHSQMPIESRRQWGLAMPPGTVQAWHARIGELPAMYLRIRAPIPFAEAFYHSCMQGWIVVDAVSGGAEHAVVNVYREFGYCE